MTKLLHRIEITNEIKMYILQVCVTNIRQGLADDQPVKIARCVRILCNFIMEFEFNKHDRPKIENPDILFTINN